MTNSSEEPSLQKGASNLPLEVLMTLGPGLDLNQKAGKEGGGAMGGVTTAPPPTRKSPGGGGEVTQTQRGSGWKREEVLVGNPSSLG